MENNSIFNAPKEDSPLARPSPQSQFRFSSQNEEKDEDYGPSPGQAPAHSTGDYRDVSLKYRIEQILTRCQPQYSPLFELMSKSKDPSSHPDWSEKYWDYWDCMSEVLSPTQFNEYMACQKNPSATRVAPKERKILEQIVDSPRPPDYVPECDNFFVIVAENNRSFWRAHDYRQGRVKAWFSSRCSPEREEVVSLAQELRKNDGNITLIKRVRDAGEAYERCMSSALGNTKFWEEYAKCKNENVNPETACAGMKRRLDQWINIFVPIYAHLTELGYSNEEVRAMGHLGARNRILEIAKLRSLSVKKWL